MFNFSLEVVYHCNILCTKCGQTKEICCDNGFEDDWKSECNHVHNEPYCRDCCPCVKVPVQ